MERLLVGCDPDVDRSGFALWYPERKALELQQYKLFGLMVQLSALNARYDLTVYLEAGHKVKQFWHRKSVKIAKEVGRNSEVGSQIETYMIDAGIRHVLIPPAGYSNYDHATFCKITGWNPKVRTNPETRAAGMMVYGR